MGDSEERVWNRFHAVVTLFHTSSGMNLPSGCCNPMVTKDDGFQIEFCPHMSVPDRSQHIFIP